MHAIGRRAVHEEETVRRPAHRERAVERERVRRAAAVALGRDHHHLAEVGKRIGKMREARREVPVVVGEKDPHPARPSGPGKRGETRWVAHEHRAAAL
jgi:hypothetical protein